MSFLDVLNGLWDERDWSCLGADCEEREAQEQHDESAHNKGGPDDLHLAMRLRGRFVLLLLFLRRRSRPGDGRTHFLRRGFIFDEGEPHVWQHNSRKNEENSENDESKMAIRRQGYTRNSNASAFFFFYLQ